MVNAQQNMAEWWMHMKTQLNSERTAKHGWTVNAHQNMAEWWTHSNLIVPNMHTQKTTQQILESTEASSSVGQTKMVPSDQAVLSPALEGTVLILRKKGQFSTGIHILGLVGWGWGVSGYSSVPSPHPILSKGPFTWTVKKLKSH